MGAAEVARDDRAAVTTRPCRLRPAGSTSTRYDFELIAVSYHSRDQLKQLQAALPVDLPLAIIDNANGADHVEDLVRDRPHGRYLDSGGGKGFAKAANLGVRTSDYQHLVFVNPDSRPTEAVFRELVAELAADPALASVAAATVDADGRIELGIGGWEPTVRRTIVHAIGAHKLFPRAGLFARPEVGENVSLDWLSGPCMAVHRTVFEQLGGFDERYFVYNEDMAYGRRAREAGLRQRLRTDVLVPHLGGRSGGSSTSMLRLRGAAMAAYLLDHNPRLRARLMQGVLVVGSALRVLQCLWLRRWDRARGFLAYARGLLFGRGGLA